MPPASPPRFKIEQPPDDLAKYADWKVALGARARDLEERRARLADEFPNPVLLDERTTIAAEKGAIDDAIRYGESRVLPALQAAHLEASIKTLEQELDVAIFEFLKAFEALGSAEQTLKVEAMRLSFGHGSVDARDAAIAEHTACKITANRLGTARANIEGRLQGLKRELDDLMKTSTAALDVMQTLSDSQIAELLYQAGILQAGRPPESWPTPIPVWGWIKFVVVPNDAGGTRAYEHLRRFARVSQENNDRVMEALLNRPTASYERVLGKWQIATPGLAIAQ